MHRRFRVNVVMVVLAIWSGMFVVAPQSARADEITFEQILAAPDDYRLNLAFARQEIAKGRLQQAASALERILLLKPNWDAVRLYYGVVLYRLKDFEAAKRELTILEGRDLSAQQEADRVRYLALATKNSKPFRITSRYTIGVRLDSNPNRASEQVIANNGTNPFANVGADSEFGVVGRSNSRIEWDFGNGRGDYIFAETNGLLTDFLESSGADYYSSKAKLGIKVHANRIVLTPYAIVGTAGLQYEKLRTLFGGGGSLGFEISPSLTVQAGLRSVYEDYQITSYSPLGDQRDGWKTTASGSATWRPTDTQIFGAAFHWTDKNAQNNGFSFQRSRIDLRSRTFFEGGWYLAVSGGYAQTNYEAPDNFYTTTFARNDRDVYVRGAIGAPLGTIFKSWDVELPSFFASTVAQVGVTWSGRNSNVNALNVNNTSGDFLLTKRFRF